MCANDHVGTPAGSAREMRMGREQPPSYYDAVYARAAHYQASYRESGYLPLWRAMAADFDLAAPVIDLGCGVGQTAEMFRDAGLRTYRGIDSSPTAIRLAAQRLADGADDFRFFCDDIAAFLAAAPVDAFDGAQWFVCETLEHIEHDVEILAWIAAHAPGSRIAVSLPSFDDPGHVRHFATMAAVLERYGPYLVVERSGQINRSRPPASHAWFYLSGRACAADGAPRITPHAAD